MNWRFWQKPAPAPVDPATQQTDEEFARDVERLHASPTIQRIFNSIEGNYGRDMLDEPDPAKREELYRMVKATRNLRASLQSLANNDRVIAYNRRLANQQSVR